jgi:hypothetical protein
MILFHLIIISPPPLFLKQITDQLLAPHPTALSVSFHDVVFRILFAHAETLVDSTQHVLPGAFETTEPAHL